MMSRVAFVALRFLLLSVVLTLDFSEAQSSTSPAGSALPSYVPPAVAARTTAVARDVAPSLQEGLASALDTSQVAAENAVAKATSLNENVAPSSTNAQETAGLLENDLLGKANSVVNKAQGAAQSGQSLLAAATPSALTEAANIDTSCMEKVEPAIKTFQSCAKNSEDSGDRAFCLCVDKFNISVAVCIDDKAASLAAAAALGAFPRYKSCQPWVEEFGSKLFTEISGSMRLMINNNKDFELLKEKAKAVEGAIAKVTGTSPKDVSVVLTRFVNPSRRLDGDVTDAAVWLANYTISLPKVSNTSTGDSIVTKLESVPKDELETALKDSFVEATGTTPGMSAEMLPVQVNGKHVVELPSPAPAPVVTSSPTLSPTLAPFVPLPPTATDAPTVSWFDAHWVQVVLVAFAIALLGVCLISGAICFGKKKPNQKKRSIAARPVPGTRSANAPIRATPPPSFQPLAVYPAPVATMSAPLATYTAPAVRAPVPMLQPAAPQYATPMVMPLMSQATASRGIVMAPRVGAASAPPYDAAAQASALFDKLDTNHDGTISRSEFEAIMASQRRM